MASCPECQVSHIICLSNDKGDNEIWKTSSDEGCATSRCHGSAVKKYFANAEESRTIVQILGNGMCPEGHVSQVCRLNDKSDNGLQPGALNRSLDIYLKTEVNPKKPHLGQRLMKDVQPDFA